MKEKETKPNVAPRLDFGVTTSIKTCGAYVHYLWHNGDIYLCQLDITRALGGKAPAFAGYRSEVDTVRAQLYGEGHPRAFLRFKDIKGYVPTPRDHRPRWQTVIVDVTHQLLGGPAPKREPEPTQMPIPEVSSEPVTVEIGVEEYVRLNDSIDANTKAIIELMDENKQLRSRVAALENRDVPLRNDPMDAALDILDKIGRRGLEIRPNGGSHGTGHKDSKAA